MGLRSFFRSLSFSKKSEEINETSEQTIKLEKKVDLVEFFNSYLTMMKLQYPKNLVNHEIKYNFTERDILISLEKWRLREDTILKGYKEHFEIIFNYFERFIGRGITLQVTSYYNGDKGKTENKLSISIGDTNMKSVMTQEFRDIVESIFNFPVYTSDEFKKESYSVSMDYEREIIESPVEIRDAFIKITSAIEKLGVVEND